MLDFKAAIFDLDGTLFDSMWVWKKIDMDFLEARGIAVPPGYFETISSMTFRETAIYTIGLFNLPETPEQIMDEWNAMAEDTYARLVTLKRGAAEYLLRLKARGVKLATATSLPDNLSLPALRHNNIHSLFDAFCSVDEVKRGKHFPDIYLLAAEKLRVPPGDCAVFEDILAGIKAVKEAGMRPYGVFDESSEKDQDEIKALCEVYVRSFEELLG